MRHNATKFAALLLCAMAFAVVGAQRAQANTFVVNSTADGGDSMPGDGICRTSISDPNGVCTLRAAIQEANARSGTDTITFDIGTGNPVITPASGLPFITTPVIINGNTGGATRVQISGASAGNAYGLVVGTGSDGSQVSSLVIRDFAIDGLVLANNVTVQNCYIGTDVTGTVKQGNGNDGMRVDGNNNLIGGTTAGTGNVISGNAHYGVHVILTASGNQIQGNRIGVNAAGTAAIGNGKSGIFLDCNNTGCNVSNNTIGGLTAVARNIISGNAEYGVALSGVVPQNKVQGNYIGTDVNGTIALKNNTAGVFLEKGAGNNAIGGTVAGAGNVISGNGLYGMMFTTGATSNIVQGNFIGTDSSATKRLGNGVHGIYLTGNNGSSAANNVIGGASAGNIISANGNLGVAIDGLAHDNAIQGNFIGTDITGTADLGNVAGLAILASNNPVGGTGLGNIIAFNRYAGVSVGAGTGNAVLDNSIFSNGGLGIDLYNDDVTPNDAGDGDTGPNNGQNFPVLTSATSNSSTNTMVVQGSLNSISGATFTIQFFSSPAADPSSYGEGQTFLGSTKVTTDSLGDVSFTVTLNTAVPGGQVITATATDASNNTSEFSKAVLVTQATPTPTPTPVATPTPASQLQNLSTRKLVGTADNVLIGGFIIVGTDDKKVMLRGLGRSLPVSGALDDPTLELHRADTTLLAANDNWKDTQRAEIEATGIPPSNDFESAIVATLAAKPASQGGAGYTGILAGKGGTTGIGLLEIYDLNIAANSKLANISTRGLVGTGDDLLIGGFIPGPSDRAPIRMLLRGLGPSLSNQGVSGALQDPVLELHDSNGATLVANDNWHDASNASEIASILPPPDSREAAILITLPPADHGYTGVVRGANGLTGVGLVEVYALQ